ncbi:hemolysin family protein [Anthocerotibacter panamensis]|uniref:hemolysin family protein n=1 Tax=Anthocerotibacter panamensis TaxID=2857077 RepID=UPI001C407567|nr:hemolysin family protein [Anthocerotibacter panamensis]
MATVEIPLTWPEITTRLLIIALLVLLNACFVAVEFALVAARPTRIDQLVEHQNRAARAVQRSQRDLDTYLSATQLGITLASLGLGWIGESTLVALFDPLLQALGVLLPAMSLLGAGVVHLVAIVVSFTLVSFLHIVLGELAPKSLAIQYPERVALALAGPNELFARVFAPFLWVLNHSARFILSSLGIVRAEGGHGTAMGPEELQLLITASSKSGTLREVERELLTNVIEFKDVVASEVMIPRTRMDALSFEATVQDVLTEVARSGHSRYPIYSGSLDNIVGLVHIKDVVKALSREHVSFQDGIRGILRTIKCVPEDKPIGELLPQMQKERQGIVIVADEFGGTAGLVTLEDLVEEIVGNITDEPEETMSIVLHRDENRASVQAQADVEEVNAALGLTLPLSEDYQTLAGFVIYHMQKIPESGEKYIHEGELEFTILAANGPRLEEIEILQRNCDPASSSIA